MLAPLWNQLLAYPLLNILVGLYQLIGDLGWSIIAFTVGLRLLMTPLVIPGLKISKKMQELAPELKKLKEQYKDNKQGLLTAQSELYKRHNINPSAGCLPQIIQMVVLIALFNTLNILLSHQGQDLINQLKPALYSFNTISESFQLKTSFFGWNLTEPDVIRFPGLPFPFPGLLLLLSAVTQLVSSVMMLPAVKAETKAAEKTSEDFDDTMVAMQSQMIYTMPFITLIFGYQFDTGLVLYWLAFSVIAMIQQYFVLGLGGLTTWLKRFGFAKI